MLIKTSELEGTALDYAVAVAQGWALDPHRPVDDGQMVIDGKISLLQWLRFSTDWHHGGPLLDRYRITIDTDDYSIYWAQLPESKQWSGGPTHLVATCRAIVAANLGDEVEMPEGLTAVRGGGP